MGSEWMQFFLQSPALILIVGGLVLGFFPRKLANIIAVLLPVWVLYAVWQIPREVGADHLVAHIAGFELLLQHVHKFTHIFATVFAIAALGGGIFALKSAKLKEIAAAYIYAGGAIGVTFSGDFFSLFIYWELMAIASTVVLLCGGTDQSFRASIRYAAMHFLGGVLLMVGIIAYASAHGNVLLAPLVADGKSFAALLQFNKSGIAVWFILAGILVNAAAPPFSAWLPDAYPESSPSGAVFLSAFTTKTAVFTLLTLFAGNEVLIYIGLFMVFYGIVYAMLENDVRRILAYSIVSQVGFMVAGTGIGTLLAQYGVAAHAFCHIIYKAVLMMSMGSVLFMTRRRKCTELGGLYSSMKLTTICGVIGALSISAFPFTSGFVSKSMISSATANEHLFIVWMLLAAASAGTFMYVGIRLPWFVFFNKDVGLRPKDPPFNMRMAMAVFAILCIIPGVFPEWIYFMLPAMPDYEPNTLDHIITQLQLLLFAGLAFFVMLPLIKRTDTISLDSDWFYRVFVLNLLHLIDGTIIFMSNVIFRFAKRQWEHFTGGFHTINSPGGVMARNWPIGVTMMWIILLLGMSLLVYYTGL